MQEGGSDDAAAKREERRKNRKPGMKIYVHVHERVFPLCIGSGEQSVRWLSVVAATHKSRPRGRLRHRESKQQLDGNFVPIAVSRESKNNKSKSDSSNTNSKYRSGPNGRRPQQFTAMHPKTKLKDVLQNGDHVYVRLKMDDKQPNFTPFQSQAFNNSEAAKARRVMEEKKRQRREAADARKKMEEAARRKDRLFGGFSEATPAQIAEAFDFEWDAMGWGSGGGNAKVKVVMKEAYLPLRTAFKHYANFNVKHSKTERSLDTTMGLSEFIAFVQDVGLLGADLSKKAVTIVYRDVAANNGAAAGGGGLGGTAAGGGGGGGGGASPKGSNKGGLQRPGFMLALFKLAKKKYFGQYSGDVAMQFDALLTDHVLPQMRSILAEDIKSRLVEEENAKIIMDNLNLMRDVYTKYAKNNSVQSQSMAGLNESTVIDVVEFEKIFIDVGLLDSTDLKRSQLSTAFIDSQAESFDVQMMEEGEDYSFDRQMVFVEFIEAVARVANEKWKGISTDIQLKMMFKTLSTLL